MAVLACSAEHGSTIKAVLVSSQCQVEHGDRAAAEGRTAQMRQNNKTHKAAQL
jgi:hypothetical protein